MTFGSLFAGIGGLDLGLERAGMQCRWQIENDPYCNKVLAKHWPHVKRYGDITGISGDELEPVDLICGGFPCQDLSQAGKRIGIEGSRSGLWFEYARLLGVVGPRYVLIENVPGLLVPGAMRRVVGELARLGYVGIWRSLRASEFGASHLRKRVFLVAYREHTGFLFSGTSHNGNGDHASGDHVNRCHPHVAHGNDERCGEAGGIRRGTGSEEAQPLRDGNHVAHGKSGGLGELRQSSGGNGLTDGSNGSLGYSSHDNGWRGISREEAGTGKNGIGGGEIYRP